MEERVTQAKYALRLQASIQAEAERLAKAEGTTLIQFINVAVAEKIAALWTTDFFRERVRRANVPGALALLGRDEPSRRDQEMNSNNTRHRGTSLGAFMRLRKRRSPRSQRSRSRRRHRNPGWPHRPRSRF
jgi:hypothetical protein